MKAPCRRCGQWIVPRSTHPCAAVWWRKAIITADAYWHAYVCVPVERWTGE